MKEKTTIGKIKMPTLHTLSVSSVITIKRYHRCVIPEHFKKFIGTVAIIFGPDQLEEEAGFLLHYEESCDGSIIYIGDRCVNFTEGHDTYPRNKLVIVSNEPGHEAFRLPSLPKQG